MCRGYLGRCELKKAMKCVDRTCLWNTCEAFLSSCVCFPFEGHTTRNCLYCNFGWVRFCFWLWILCRKFNYLPPKLCAFACCSYSGTRHFVGKWLTMVKAIQRYFEKGFGFDSARFDCDLRLPSSLAVHLNIWVYVFWHVSECLSSYIKVMNKYSRTFAVSLIVWLLAWGKYVSKCHLCLYVM